MSETDFITTLTDAVDLTARPPIVNSNYGNIL